MGQNEGENAYGQATIEPGDAVVAASYGTWRLTYVVGERGLAPGGVVRVSTDSDTDWALPQFTDQAAADYATLAGPSDAALQVVVRGLRELRLVNRGRALRAGERLTLTLGDRGGGGPGSRAQTFQELRRNFLVAVDAEGTGRFVGLEDSPWLSVVGGPATRLVVVVPSTAGVGEPFRLLLRAQDDWGNPAAGYTGTVRLEGAGLALPAGQYAFQTADRGVRWLEDCRWLEPGLRRVTARDEQSGLTAESNPCLCTAEAGETRLYWGEPHGGQLTLPENIPHFFSYARDVAGIDFVGYQRNDHEMSDADWAAQQRYEREFYAPGRFVPLPGFEWSGPTAKGGDHNVFFRRHGQPLRRSGHEWVEDGSDASADLTHIKAVHRAYRLADVVIIPHVGGRAANLEYHEPRLEPTVEVTSTHGTFDWFWREALARGYQVGVVGGSDGYTCRPGAEYPGEQERRFAKGGLTAIWAEELSLDGVLDAITARRCYATTGARLLLEVEADGQPLGAAYHTSGQPSLRVRVAGTAALQSVALYRGTELVYSHALDARPNRGRLRLVWEGASRQTSYTGIVWDGRLRLAGGSLGEPHGLRFDSPRSHAALQGGELRWHAVACGYPSGVEADVEGDDEAQLELAVSSSRVVRPLLGGHGDAPPSVMAYITPEPLLLRCRLGELAGGAKVLELGPVERRVTLGLASQDAPRDVEFTWTDPNPRPGVNAYWVKVVQSDLELAWSSPVFVEYRGE
ncbi:MAG: DUF3604 domain-containing protein [Chloroflexota bacterium]